SQGIDWAPAAACAVNSVLIVVPVASTTTTSSDAWAETVNVMVVDFLNAFGDALTPVIERAGAGDVVGNEVGVAVGGGVALGLAACVGATEAEGVGAGAGV